MPQLPDTISGFLSLIPVPFWLSPRARPLVGFEYTELASNSTARAWFLLGGFLVVLGGFALVVGIVEPLAIAILAGAILLSVGCGLVALAARESATTRILRYTTASRHLSLIRIRGDRQIGTIEAPIADCDAALHPIHYSAYRNPTWDGYAILIHLREGYQRGHFAIGVFKSQAAAAAAVEHLPQPLKDIYRSEGPRLNVGLYIRLTTRRVRRASNAHCPQCGYDLAPLLAQATQCPECGWHSRSSR